MGYMVRYCVSFLDYAWCRKDSSKNPRIKARMSDKVLAATSEDFTSKLVAFHWLEHKIEVYGYYTGEKRRQRALISVSDKEGLVELAKACFYCVGLPNWLPIFNSSMEIKCTRRFKSMNSDCIDSMYSSQSVLVNAK